MKLIPWVFLIRYEHKFVRFKRSLDISATNAVDGKQEYGATYRPIKVCVESVTSLVTKVINDNVTMMTSSWNTSGMFKMSKISDMLRHHDVISQ